MSVDLKNLSHNQLNDLINQARVRQEELQKEKFNEVREKVLNIIKEEGFTFDDIFGARAPRKTRRTGTVAPKFQNPADPAQTWSGRGKRPRWFNDALAAGKSEDELRIKG